MKVKITDAEVLKQIGIREVTAYLRSQGWQQTGRFLDTLLVWTKEAGSPRIFVPRSSEFDDYAERMADILAILSRYEQRSQQQILTDIEEVVTDVVRIRLVGNAFANGDIPLDNVTELVAGARNLVLAAACTTVQPRSVYAGRKPAEAIEYLSRVRFGQTERGSYVLTLRSTVPPRLSGNPETSLFPDLPVEASDPFEQRVLLTLANGLKETKVALEDTLITGQLEAFYKGVQKGVSANLCEALANLMLEEKTREVVIYLYWSPVRQVDSKTPRQVSFSADQLPMLQEVARIFRERTPYDAFELTGAVVRLERADGESVGRVTVAGFVEGRARHVQFELAEAEYQSAIEAHRDGTVISVEGELELAGKVYRLRNPRRFTLEVV